MTELPIPAHMRMKETAHGSGLNGMAFYNYEDVDGLGVMLDARRKEGRSPFVETWRFRWLPDGEFPTYQALRAAVAELSEEQVATERAKWPKMIEPPQPSENPGGGRCWLHKDRPRTHRAWVQACWHKFDGITAMLCAECATEAANDPGVIVRANDQRRADVAARKDDDLLRKLTGAA